MTARRTTEETTELRETLVSAARDLVRREGARALTMRGVAREAGCAVGLPYKVFRDREELLLKLIELELGELTTRLNAWVGSAGSHTVGGNLDRYATILLGSETPALMHANELDDVALAAAVREVTLESGLGHSFDEAIAAYLDEEQRLGRIRADVDTAAFGFLVTGAVHNLVMAGDLYPRPSRRTLRRFLTNCARAIGAD